MGRVVGVDRAPDGVHLADVIARRREDAGEDLFLFALRQVFRAGGQAGQDQQGHADNAQDQRHPAAQPGQQPVHEAHDQPAGALSQAIHPEARGWAGIGLQEAAAGHGDHGDRHDHRHQDRGRDGDGDIRIKLARLFPDEDDRQEHEHRGQGRGQHRAPDLAHPGQRGLHPGLAEAHVPVDILQHHDAVIQRHADRKRDPRQRDHIQRAA